MQQKTLFALAGLVLLAGCFPLTRVERDRHTIIERDTLTHRSMNNAPGDRDNGTIYPSPTSTEAVRRYVQHDSDITRSYPAFLRLGGIEAMGAVTSGISRYGPGAGLFGLYGLGASYQQGGARIFGANMYRVMPLEVRLRWLHDAPDWTVGTAAGELFMQESNLTDSLIPGRFLLGVLPLYLRRRFFLREEIPYVMIVPFAGIAVFPSQYVNTGVTLDVGSFGGFNLRGYVGYIAGTSSLFRRNTRRFVDTRNYGAAFPYAGIGISALDFVNKTEELYTEWKDQKHSALEISVLNLELVRSLSSNVGQFQPTVTPGAASPLASIPLTGAIVRLASATYPLPLGERRLFVGTSLLNVLAISATQVGFGFLPVRVGYRFNVLYDEINLEPFAEYTYYPQGIIHLGARLSLRIFEYATVDLAAGYAAGAANVNLSNGLQSFGASANWSAPYLGIGIGLGDVFHTPEQVMR
ncbi:MAG: hypothetical protein JST22_06355 [Bacteroidetes bacterium]|nr:hypothetical protein [Bacteroidota bacterium]